MRICTVCVPYQTGGGTITKPLTCFLRKAGHDVIQHNYYYLGTNTFLQKKIRQLLGWRLGLIYRDWLIQRELRYLINNIREARFDVIIAIEQGEILLHDFGDAKKIFYANAPTGHEVYFNLARSQKPFDLSAFKKACKKEVAYYKASDFILFCWNTHGEYVRDKVYQGNNIIDHPGLGWYGCDPQQKRAQYNYPPLLAYTGLVTAYWNNAALLSRLVSKVPYAINIYGSHQPPPELGLRYQGFAESLDVLCHYQFGLHTATDDLVRQYGFASKLMTYLSYGLPSFSPEWQLVSNQLRGVIPFTEENFKELLEDAAKPAKWLELSDMAYEQAHALEWAKVLEPLNDLL